ncbi:phosphatidylglycerophosphatase A [Niastella caeni]|uniref:Phosphatidylglycerophosphatase A n=1 Tax=Niastella caeni TaxID=2569763 RepID=A0A4S8HVT8_9BACT|nr:phosphatidylglycerophosphatase A [Niastella caeni]THU39808.1 phosphatidylglycerophosphatase A [Niastella caeni]
MELKRWEKVAGSFFYVGYKMKGPGTVTSVLVFLVAWFVKPDAVLPGALLVLTPLSFYLGYRFEKCIGHDPSCFTLDEVIGSLIVVCFIPHELVYYFLFFIVWRLFDIFKPFFKPVEQIQQGIGIVLDDIIGAICTLGMYFLYTWLI